MFDLSRSTSFLEALADALEEKKYPFPIYRDGGMKTAERLKLEEETLCLLLKEQCISCLKEKRVMLNIPCGHVLSCENCVQSSCQGCKLYVTEMIRSFR